MEITENRQSIFGFITSEVNNFQVLPITIVEGYDWSLYKHIRLTTLYKNSQFETGNFDDKPFKNIMRPILNLQYRAEGFDLKDIVLFVEERKNYYKSFLIKKYHQKWARDNGMDEFIDQIVETYVDMGGVLVKKVKGKIPEIVPWQSIAFCDQTDVLSGPVCIKHYYSPDRLKETESIGWGNVKNGATATIEELIELSGAYKSSDQTKKESKTPGKYVEVYELHGTLPDIWLDKDDSESEGYQGKWGKFTRQLQIIGYYQKEDGKKEGVCLYKGKEENPFKFKKRTPEVFGKALGTGGGEELFESQVWTNYDMIRIRDMLDAASKIILQTADGKIAKRQNVRGLDNLSILQHDLNMPLTQVPTTPVNLRLFENAVAEWEQHARTTGAATESIMGEQPASGTPFKLQELVTAESHSLHEYRKGKIADFLDEIYRDWIIPQIVSEINQGQEFLAELDLDELQEVADNVVANEANKINKERVLNGENILPPDQLKEQIRQGFMRSGKKFIRILKDELKEAPVDIKINISGKQKYLSQITDKLVNVFRMVLQAPQVLQNPAMAKLFNSIIENSGLSPIDFSGLNIMPQPMQGQGASQPEANLATINQ